MVRIRKKSSKRGKTHLRERVKHKVTEHRRKSKKEAKKNPQWKSRHKKDPGIPNSLPFKAEILAEIAEERRLAEEVKQKRKEAKKAAKEGKAVEVPEEKEEKLPEDGEEGVAHLAGVGITALPASSTISKAKRSKSSVQSEHPVDESRPKRKDAKKRVKDDKATEVEEDGDKDEDMAQDDGEGDADMTNDDVPMLVESSTASKVKSSKAASSAPSKKRVTFASSATAQNGKKGVNGSAADKKAKGTAQVKEGEEAYDFGKFF